MAEMSDVLTLITQYGFPIVCCVWMAMYIKTTTERYNKQIEDITDKYAEKINEITVVMKETTTAVTSLINFIKNGGQ